MIAVAFDLLEQHCPFDRVRTPSAVLLGSWDKVFGNALDLIGNALL